MKSSQINRFKKPKSKEFLSVFQQVNASTPRFEILEDENFVDKLKDSGPLEYPENIAITGYDCAKLIYTALGNKLDNVYLDDPCLWEWLSYFFIDNLKVKGIKHMHWYSPTKGMQIYTRWYKHFIRQAVYSYHLFGEDSKIQFSKNLGSQSDMIEQVCGNPEAMMKKNILRLVNILYLNEDRSDLRKVGSAGTGPGAIRDLTVFIKRLRKTYDVDSLKAEEIYEMLPPIFDRYK